MADLSRFFMRTPVSDTSLSDTGPRIIYVTATEDSENGMATVSVGDEIDYDESTWDSLLDGAVLMPGNEDREDLIDDDMNAFEEYEYDPYAGETSSDDNRSDEEPDAPQEVE